MRERILKIITILGIVTMLGIFFLPAMDPGFSGYRTPASLEEYGIFGEEETWTVSEFFGFSPDEVSVVSISKEDRILLLLETHEEIEDFIETIENCFTVVDQKCKYALGYRTQWEPYWFMLQLRDGTEVEFGLSIIKEPSRIFYAEDELYEVLVPEDIIFLLEREFGMKR